MYVLVFFESPCVNSLLRYCVHFLVTNSIASFLFISNKIFTQCHFVFWTGNAPPYLIYLDHDNHEIVVAIRGLNLVKESDYKVLMDNKLGKQMFDGGYVHHGLLKAAIWMLNKESETLKKLWVENGKSYKMIFAGHSLGSGVASLLTIIVANHGDRLGGIPRSLISCYAVAPARCMSLNLAVKYADIIHSVILQVSWFSRHCFAILICYDLALATYSGKILLLDLYFVH